MKKTWSTLDKRDGSIKLATNLGDFRGIVVKKRRQQKGALFIPYIYIKSDHTGALVLRIEDGEHSYPFTFDSVAGSISKVGVNFNASGEEVHILLPDVIDVYSVQPNMQIGMLPKCDFATCVGYCNGLETEGESFGIWANVEFISEITSTPHVHKKPIDELREDRAALYLMINRLQGITAYFESTFAASRLRDALAHLDTLIKLMEGEDGSK